MSTPRLLQTPYTLQNQQLVLFSPLSHPNYLWRTRIYYMIYKALCLSSFSLSKRQLSAVFRLHHRYHVIHESKQNDWLTLIVWILLSFFSFVYSFLFFFVHSLFIHSSFFSFSFFFVDWIDWLMMNVWCHRCISLGFVFLSFKHTTWISSHLISYLTTSHHHHLLLIFLLFLSFYR